MSNQRSTRTFRRAAGLAAGLLTGTGLAGINSAHAQAAAPAPPPPPPPPPRWESSINAGMTLTRGNSDTFLATIAGETKKKWERDDAALSATFGYGENKDDDGENQKTEHYARAAAQWNHLFTERFYAGVRLDALYDEIADVDYRFVLSPLAGYYLVKNPETFFRVEAGPSFVYERVGHDTTGYIAARLSERLEHKISATAKIWEQVDYLPQLDKFQNYLILAEAGIETAINKSLSLRVVAQDTYDHEPAPGRDQNDFKLMAGLGYKF